MNSIFKRSDLQTTPWWLIVALMLVFVGLRTYQTARQPRLGSSDVQNIGTMVKRDLNPGLFENDYAYSDPSFLRFYSPGYMAIIRTMTGWVGDYETGLVILFPLALFSFIFGMYRLLRLIGVRWWIALLVACAMTYGQFTATGDRTGYIQLNGAMANSLHLAIQPWLWLLGFKWLYFDPKNQKPAAGWRFGIFGLLIGLSTIVHIGPGFRMAQLVGGILLLYAASKDVKLSQIAWFVLGAAVGASPAAWVYLSNTLAGGTADGDFATHAHVIRERSGIIFPYPEASLLGVTIGQAGQIGGVIAYTITTILTASAALIWKDTRPTVSRAMYLIFGLAQAMMAALMAWDTPMLLIAICWWIVAANRRWRSIDGLLMNATAVINLMVWVITPLLVLVWSRAEILSISTLTWEEARGSMLIFWPLRLILGRAFDRASTEIKAPAHGIILTLALLVAGSPPESYRWQVIILIFLAILIGLPRTRIVPEPIMNGLSVTSAAIGLSYIVMRGLGFTQFSLTVLAVGLVAGLTITLIRGLPSTGLRAAVGVLGVALSLGAIWTIPGNTPLDPPTMVGALRRAPPTWRTHWSYDRTPEVGPEDLALIDIATWTNAHIPEGAVIYTHLFEFRYYSERPITHSWKDIGSAYYSPGGRAVEFYDRYHLFEAGYTDPDLFWELVEDYAVDYILIGPERSVAADIDGLEACYMNDIYQLLAVRDCPR